MRQRSSYGWLELIIGILLSALGIYSFFRPVDYLTTLIVVYGVAAFVPALPTLCSTAKWSATSALLRRYHSSRAFSA